MTNEHSPERYGIALAPGARRGLEERLPEAAAGAAWQFIVGPLAQRPHRVGAQLRAPFEGLWRARRGEYRVRYRIDDITRQVITLDVSHRGDAYRS